MKHNVPNTEVDQEAAEGAEVMEVEEAALDLMTEWDLPLAVDLVTVVLVVVDQEAP